MNERWQIVADRLAGAAMCFLATVDNGKPRVRPFQHQFALDNKLWFGTGKSKAVCRQLQANPWVEICAVGPDAAWLRVSGQVIFADDRAIKERILAGQELIRSRYNSAAHPDLAVFYLEHGTYALDGFPGIPPRTGKF